MLVQVSRMKKGGIMKKFIYMLTVLASMFIAGELIAGDMVNINTANVEQLQQVKGIGAKTAAAIVAYRESHGDFTDVNGLMAVKGIGEKKLENIKGELSVGEPK